MVSTAQIRRYGNTILRLAEADTGDRFEILSIPLCSPTAEEVPPEPLPAKEDAANEEESVPAEPVKRNPLKERRHLAGANWLDDWTRYFPIKKPKSRRAPKK